MSFFISLEKIIKLMLTFNVVTAKIALSWPFTFMFFSKL